AAVLLVEVVGVDRADVVEPGDEVAVDRHRVGLARAAGRGDLGEGLGRRVEAVDVAVGGEDVGELCRGAAIRSSGARVAEVEAAPEALIAARPVGAGARAAGPGATGPRAVRAGAGAAEAGALVRRAAPDHGGEEERSKHHGTHEGLLWAGWGM